MNINLAVFLSYLEGGKLACLGYRESFGQNVIPKIKTELIYDFKMGRLKKYYEIKCCGIVRNLVESVRFCDILDKT